jgi:hypothetical protein
VLAFYLLTLAGRRQTRVAVGTALRAGRFRPSGGAGVDGDRGRSGDASEASVSRSGRSGDPSSGGPSGARPGEASVSAAGEASLSRSGELSVSRSGAATVPTSGAASLAPPRALAVRAQQLSPAALQALAGAALVTAIAIKASSAVLVPVVAASMLRRPRELAWVFAGGIVAAAVLGSASVFAFGLHIPDLNTQSSLVTSESVPNLIGMALGLGGETETLRAVLAGGLALWLLGCCWLAFKRRDAITASGWASVALLVALSWVLPWYVLWALPMAALSRSRALRRATVVVGLYLIVAWSPASFRLWNLINFHPEKTALGRQHQRAVREFLD